MSDPQVVTVTVQRKGSAGDGAGGVTEAWAAVSGLDGLSMSMRHYTSQSINRIENGGENSAGGPGVSTARKALFVYHGTLPATALVNDRVLVGTEYYAVHGVRVYEHTAQLDTERVA